MHALADQAGCLKTLLCVLLARVLTNHDCFPLKAFSISQRHAVLVEIAFVFGWIEFEAHSHYCINNKFSLQAKNIFALRQAPLSPGKGANASQGK